MIIIERLTKVYDSADRAALDGVDLKIRDGEFVRTVQMPNVTGDDD